MLLPGRQLCGLTQLFYITVSGNADRFVEKDVWNAHLQQPRHWICGITLQLYKLLVGPRLEYCVQFLSPHHRKDVIKLEKGQNGFTGMLPDRRA